MASPNDEARPNLKTLTTSGYVSYAASKPTLLKCYTRQEKQTSTKCTS